eukprot:TRINITY_DN28296_c0_g1_i1.p1 TRINITY_DN28296_c0_g1~~TRINITY_DN28296_c0_g1_i1.p1  ORF type:complete len:317 (-),score=85.10 TRINITY_DN28296_c0_g1_i1:152-1060(-)
MAPTSADLQNFEPYPHDIVINEERAYAEAQRMAAQITIRDDDAELVAAREAARNKPLSPSAARLQQSIDKLTDKVGRAEKKLDTYDELLAQYSKSSSDSLALEDGQLAIRAPPPPDEDDDDGPLRPLMDWDENPDPETPRSEKVSEPARVVVEEVKEVPKMRKPSKTRKEEKSVQDQVRRAEDEKEQAEMNERCDRMFNRVSEFENQLKVWEDEMAGRSNDMAALDRWLEELEAGKMEREARFKDRLNAMESEIEDQKFFSRNFGDGKAAELDEEEQKEALFREMQESMKEPMPIMDDGQSL